jgi:hypothetical protein
VFASRPGASLEAIRMLLPPSTEQDMIMGCPQDFGGSTNRSLCKIDWRKNTTKVIIHATYEDSDLPTNVNYQVPGQNIQPDVVTYIIVKANPLIGGPCLNHFSILVYCFPLLDLVSHIHILEKETS